MKTYILRYNGKYIVEELNSHSTTDIQGEATEFPTPQNASAYATEIGLQCTVAQLELTITEIGLYEENGVYLSMRDYTRCNECLELYPNHDIENGLCELCREIDQTAHEETGL